MKKYRVKITKFLLILFIVTIVVSLIVNDKKNCRSGFRVDILDSCEYIHRDGYPGQIIHKGDCKFCMGRLKNKK